MKNTSNFSSTCKAVSPLCHYIISDYYFNRKYTFAISTIQIQFVRYICFLNGWYTSLIFMHSICFIYYHFLVNELHESRHMAIPGMLGNE